MGEKLLKLESPTLQQKLQLLYSNPFNRGLRRAATSDNSIANLKADPLLEGNDGVLHSIAQVRELATQHVQRIKRRMRVANS